MNRRPLPRWDASESAMYGAFGLGGYVGEGGSESQIVGIGENGHTSVHGSSSATPGTVTPSSQRPPPSLLTFMHANQKSREGVINCLVFGTGVCRGVSFFCGTPICRYVFGSRGSVGGFFAGTPKSYTAVSGAAVYKYGCRLLCFVHVCQTDHNR
jgi:hypothetical protein